MIKKVALIVAHPDDETLWAGGLILSHPEWDWFVACLSRKYDEDRAPKFYKVMDALGVSGIMGDMEDGPEQFPLAEEDVEQRILELLPERFFDLIITHDLNGEYTRHLRHEETSRAVLQLWTQERISSKALWTFAYEDGHRTYAPQAIKAAELYHQLPEEIWQRKYDIMTRIYGFNPYSWEAQATPKAEAFWEFTAHTAALSRLNPTERK
ncbi:PIG-L deacetylase family protein [Pedobacter sp.]|jgi:LmbE family N-acetylglucosaminyl deacetylase|uniref:PIG-L deacetylase family protein n=1 Tax=Pedobacter sp. TaxID=1411316 RepID=UPI002C098BB7|nr:PIG-L family deacetylase [Pedobacter sp.]HWW42482.1 PIG-L family deacetylase [Pedobacter sp.]